MVDGAQRLGEQRVRGGQGRGGERGELNISSSSSSSSSSRKERSLSESEKMERLVTLCEKLEDISLELKKRGYDKTHVPTGYYSHCKAIVNYIEGFARESKVKPSMLSAIKFRKSKRIPILEKEKG